MDKEEDDMHVAEAHAPDVTGVTVTEVTQQTEVDAPDVTVVTA